MFSKPSSIIVTGSATGIAYATAQAFAHKGYHVAIVDLSQQSASDAALFLLTVPGYITGTTTSVDGELHLG